VLNKPSEMKKMQQKIIDQDKYARDVQSFKRVEERAKERIKLEKLKIENKKPPEQLPKPTQNDRLKRFNIENTFIVQDSKTKAINNYKPPNLEEMRKSAGLGNQDMMSLVAKAELSILEKEIENSVVTTHDQSDIQKAFIKIQNKKINGAKADDNYGIF
jgi:hypothetical protein